MVAIIEELHKYVPTATSVMEVERPGSSEKAEVTVDKFHYTLMGGDQLTVARARGSGETHVAHETDLRVWFLCVKTGMQKDVLSQ